MNKFWKTTLGVLLVNGLLSLIALYGNDGAVFLWLMLMLVQFIAAMVFCLVNNGQLNTLGKAILLSFGIGLVVGFSVCSILLMHG